MRYPHPCSGPGPHVRGFTLIELLIVIVILGLLLSLVAPAMFSKVSSSQRKTAMAQMQMLATALDTYRLDLGGYPEALAELRASTKPGWDGPYLPRDLPLDPWGHPYVSQTPAEKGEPYTLPTYGTPDKAAAPRGAAEVVLK